MLKPLITVLLPNYNNALYLNNAIDSILAQTFDDFEFLIIDDGSSDNSIEIIEKYDDSRIVLIKKEKNTGIVDTLNIGLEAIDTKYIVRMDGDDISLPNRLQVLFDFMEVNHEIGICGSNMKYFGNSDSETNFYLDNNRIKSRLIFSTSFSHPSCIIRTEVLKKNKIKYTNNHPYLEDYDLFFRIRKHTNFANLSNVLYYYRLLSHNSTVKNNSTLYDRYRNFYKNVIEELGIELTEENIDLHTEFFLGNSFKYKIKDYRKWIALILSKNEKQSLYPHKELVIIINDRWKNNFFYKLVPLSSGKIFTYFFYSPNLELKQIVYFLKYKINKLINRK